MGNLHAQSQANERTCVRRHSVTQWKIESRMRCGSDAVRKHDNHEPTQEQNVEDEEDVKPERDVVTATIMHAYPSVMHPLSTTHAT